MKRLSASALAGLALAGCSKPEDPKAYTRWVAGEVRTVCLMTDSGPPMNRAQAHHRQRTCDCLRTKILAMEVHEEHPEIDGDEAANSAADKAWAMCDRELGEQSGAEDYRAAGMVSRAPKAAPGTARIR